MLEQYRTVYEGGEGEITEKNHASSRQFHPVESEEEALAFLEEMKKILGCKTQLLCVFDWDEP